MTTQSKTISFGEVDYNNNGKKTNEVTIEITLKYNTLGMPIFSASGNVWNSRKSDIYMGGQCIDSIYNKFKTQLNDRILYKNIMLVWERNHLNDMNAGTPEQTALIEKWKSEGNRYDYSAVCEFLKSIDMYEVEVDGKPYKYGTSWLYREISKEDLEFIQSLLN